MRLKGKAAIVTGAGKGIGWGIAKVFVEEGAKVVIVDWDEESGKKTAKELHDAGGDTLFVKCDVSDEDQVKAMYDKAVQTYGDIDVLVNNAGVGVYKAFMDATMADWDRALSINLKGQILCSRSAVPQMQKKGKGAIVNISSVHAFQTVNGVAPYATSKGGVFALTHAMAIDLAPDDPRQRHRSGLDIHTAHPKHLRQLLRPGCTAQGDRAPRLDEADRHARGDRSRGGVPGERRSEFHNGRPAVCGWRPDSPT